MTDFWPLVGTLLTILVPLMSGIGGIIWALLRVEAGRVSAELADKELRMRKLEAGLAQCVSRDEMASLRQHIDERFDRLLEALAPAPARRARARG